VEVRLILEPDDEVITVVTPAGKTFVMTPGESFSIDQKWYFRYGKTLEDTYGAP
jgi:hypothetical protein